MRRVLVVSPHFPPDTGAASHRMRLLAPHLASAGWEPTVVAVEPGDLGARLEPGLLDLVPTSLRVVRVRALGGGRGRFLGVGDLGLRALPALRRTCLGLLRAEKFDAVLLTMPPHYTALLGPFLRRRTGVPYVLDYQDPWVSAWGRTVGGGRGGRPDLRSRLSRRLALWLEPRCVRGASGLVAVSEGTLAGVFERNPGAEALPRAEIPLGGEPADFEWVRRNPRPNPWFRGDDGLFHLSYVGTLLPHGLEVLRAFLRAVAALRREDPGAYGRLRVHFFGTSNRTTGDPPARVLPEAEALGVGEAVHEVALRIDYLEALTVLARSDAVLLLGSTEPHYTASKVYPALLSGRPILAIFHEASAVNRFLDEAGTGASVRRVPCNAIDGPPAAIPGILRALSEWMGFRGAREAARTPASRDWLASHLSRRLSGLLDTIAA